MFLLNLKQLIIIFLFFRERVNNGNCEDVDDDVVSNYCDCIHTVSN